MPVETSSAATCVRTFSCNSDFIFQGLCCLVLLNVLVLLILMLLLSSVLSILFETPSSSRGFVRTSRAASTTSRCSRQCSCSSRC